MPLQKSCRMELMAACPRNQPAVCTLADGNVLVAGGSLQGTPLKSAHVFDVSAGTWTAVADLPGPREASRAWLCDGRVFLIGGYDGNHDLNSTLEYLQEASRWVPRAAMCRRRSFFGVAEGLIQDPDTQDPEAKQPVIVVAGGGEGAAQLSVVSDHAGTLYSIC